MGGLDSAELKSTTREREEEQRTGRRTSIDNTGGEAKMPEFSLE